MRIDIASYSNIGGRNVNEDSSLVKTYGSGLIVAVADGLGGHGGGDIASSRALARLDELAAEEFPNTEQAFQKICLALNEAVLEKQTDHHRMKTTLAMAAVSGDTLFCVHIGDSRVYLFRDKEIRYQSTDHSVSQLAVFSGEITSDQIRYHEDRSRLLRSIGSEEAPTPDIRKFDHTLQPGDAILLCSDGFWEFVLEREMLQTLAWSRSAKHWLGGMMRIVRMRTRGIDNDNNTAIAIRFQKDRKTTVNGTEPRK